MFIFFVRRSGAGYYYNKFPFRFVHGKVRNQFFKCSPACLFETFRQFTRDGNLPFLPEEFDQLRQCFDDPVRRFVQDDAALFGGQARSRPLQRFASIWMPAAPAPTRCTRICRSTASR